MLFVDTTTLKLRRLSESAVQALPKGYAILSHRWTYGDDEISYTDILATGTDVRSRDSYAKFAGACSVAKSLGFEVIWNDTCCINKSDLAELSESINSMYRWYSESAVCIVYLQDVMTLSDIDQSVWLQRGWTLQELLAPKDVLFFNRDWKFLGDKLDLLDVLVDSTGIPKEALSNKIPPQQYSIAQRMSWAAKRTTERVEDRAYSLIGLFDINMPLIYGERERAFTRLQKHIIARSADESIFVLDLDLLEGSTRDPKSVGCGLLATSPACFARCGDVICTGDSKGFQANQFGISIALPTVLYDLGVYLCTLQARRIRYYEQCKIILAKITAKNIYTRSADLYGNSIIMSYQTITEMKNLTVSMDPIAKPLPLFSGLWLRNLKFPVDDLDGYYPSIPAHGQRFLLTNKSLGPIRTIRLWNISRRSQRGWIYLGFNQEHRPVCLMIFPETVSSTTPKELDKLWSQQMISAPPEFQLCSLDSRTLRTDADGGFEVNFRTASYSISISIRLIFDDEEIAKIGRPALVWAVDIVVDRPVGAREIPVDYEPE
ncbi:HET-domain-containing protein [Xylariaceae sp. FL0255]|nr:HET-domain-containing protein [Xylariaceae sp. FL0255]